MIINFNLKTNVIFGSGKRFELNNFINKKKYKNVLVFIEAEISRISIFKDFINNFTFNYTIIKCQNITPTYNFLDNQMVKIRKLTNIDAFIGIGGGATIDITKGFSVLYKNKLSAINYRGFDKFSNQPLPIIAVPTTSGTGSEITPNASFIDTLNNKKMGINGEGIRPIFSILDPELTLSCPLLPTISSGLDSMVHATEAFVAKKTNLFAQLFAKEGYQMVIEYLPLVANDLDNKLYRERVMYGAFLSAISLMNSGTGPSAAMSYPLEVFFEIPHGISGAIFLPFVVEYNISKGFYNYSKLNKPYSGENGQKGAIKFLIKLKKTLKDLKISELSKKVNFNENLHNLFLNDTLELKAALDQNPVDFKEEQVKNILKNFKIEKK